MPPSPTLEDPELNAARRVAAAAFSNAANCDHDGAFPEQEIEQLHVSGLMAAPLPRALGGVEPNADKLCALLRTIGSGSLPLGRLYEGHINAMALVIRYGDLTQQERMADEARQGELLGVWNTDDARGLHLIGEAGRWRLEGRKILASGAGRIFRPLVTATDGAGRRLMVAPRLVSDKGADLSRWTAQGMRASATGAVDFTGVLVSSDDIIGGADDYERQPFFSGGAWRFCAVHLGGMERLFDLLRRHLNESGRGADPHQAARVGEAGIAVETARLWVGRAAELAHDPLGRDETNRIVAYVNLARLAVERAGLTLMELTHRSVGLLSFMRPHPIERITRDLSTYLRQPGPDRALTTAAAWMLAQEGAHMISGDKTMSATEAIRAMQRFEFANLSDVLGSGGLVVVAPHQDDESLACGGLIAEACATGRAVRVVFVSDGTGSHPRSRTYPRARLRVLREAEALRAASRLGLAPRNLEFLRLPDRFVPREGNAARAAIERIVAVAERIEAAALFVSCHDPHCDHQAAFHLARAAQQRLSSALYEYCVWGVALKPSTPVTVVEAGFRLRIERHARRKRRAIRAHNSQISDMISDDPSGFRLSDSDLALPRALRILHRKPPMSRYSHTMNPGYFDALYEQNVDPWRFATSEYEREKYDQTLLALPHARYDRALEIGCSIGVLTSQLALRCGRLLAIDAAASPLAQARERCAGCGNVEFARMFVPGDWPEGEFDLIVLSEVVYYLDAIDVERLANRVASALAPHADVVLVHWTGETNYPLTGDEAANLFVDNMHGLTKIVESLRKPQYRLDVLSRG